MEFTGARICFALLVWLHISKYFGCQVIADWPGLTCYECTYTLASYREFPESCALVCMPKAGLDVWPDHMLYSYIAIYTPPTSF